jgi:hypothetical protein
LKKARKSGKVINGKNEKLNWEIQIENQNIFQGSSMKSLKIKFL